MNKKEKMLWKLLADLEKVSDNIETVFGGDDFLDKEIDGLWQIIMEEYGIEDSGWFADEVLNVLYDFGQGEITMKEAHKKMLEIHSEQHARTP